MDIKKDEGYKIPNEDIWKFAYFILFATYHTSQPMSSAVAVSK